MRLCIHLSHFAGSTTPGRRMPDVMKLYGTNVVLLALMLLSAVLGAAIRPTIRLADERPRINLESMIPMQFGKWHMIKERGQPIVSPDVQASLDKVYNQTLTRTYANNKGEHIMLSIAYGSDQTDAVQVHLPEGCYSGQGFAVSNKTKTTMQTLYGQIPVSRLIATQGQRNEPISYWVVIGGEVTRDLWEMKSTKLRYGFKGVIADGILVRISSITPDAAHGYEIQREFSEAMLNALTPEQRARLIGNAS